MPVIRASLADEQAAQDHAQAEEFNDLRFRAIVTGALGVVAMALSMPLMSGGDHRLHGGGDPVLGPLMNLIEPPREPCSREDVRCAEENASAAAGSG